MAEYIVHKKEPEDVIIALVGNPNVGKSTLFNLLTGLNQHTGNWPGKTVSVAQGRYSYKGKGYILVDLPGTYSLYSQSEDERIAVDYITTGQADCTLVLADATCLERNLNLALQVMEITDRVVLCVNLLDEADRRNISVDLSKLECLLGIPVVGISAGLGQGIDQLREKVRNVVSGFTHRRSNGDDSSIKSVEEIASLVVCGGNQPHSQKLDHFALGKFSGYLSLFLLLFLIFWLTIQGANYPSQLLQSLFDNLAVVLQRLCRALPTWLGSLIIDGIYATVTRVVAVMLPPMAIFFPLFTILEDFGYLPRAAFLMDHSFQKCGGCGKQVLTMAMGLGCNAVGVAGCRIISSPKERLLAILTNAMIPCNGRFPAMITLISLFLCKHSVIGAVILLGFLSLAVGMTFVSSSILQRTLLSGQESHFILELPPYRKPRIGKIIIRSILDRTIFVLGRAVAVAAPAGVVIWILQKVEICGTPLLYFLAEKLTPFGSFLGMNGAVLLAFVLAFPANELLLPLTIMIMQGGGMQELTSAATGDILTAGGWTAKTAVCVMIFLLFHWPCGTTCMTIRKECGSWKWTLTAMLLPTVIGILLCRLVCCIF